MGVCEFSPEKHVCMLPQEPKYFDLPPTAGFYRQLLCKIRELTLPCEWHHGSLLFIRSQRRLKLERDRQVEFGHWLVWHPYSPINFYWNCFMLVCMYVFFVYMPFQVFYENADPYDPFVLACDGISFIDIGIKFITGVDHEDGNKVSFSPKYIAKEYIYGVFTLDLISALPLQCIEIYDNRAYPTHTMFYLFKIFKTKSLRKLWQNVYKQIGLSYVSSSAITVFIQCTLFYHWMTYIHFQVPTFFVNYYGLNYPPAQSWFRRLKVKKLTAEPAFHKYLANLYYSCGICNGAGNYSPISGVLLPEMIMNSIISIIGLVFLTYSFTTLLRLVIYARFDIFLYNGRLKELSEYMVFKRLPKVLQQKIQLFLNYKFYEHYFNERAIMNTINEQIKQDINMHCCKKLVVNVPLFQEMPVALINTIVFSLVRMLFMPGEVVVKCDRPGQSLYLISSGTVAIINSSGREVAHLRDGAYFGESVLLKPGGLRYATVIALEITEMYKLGSKEFASCMQPYPHLKRRLENVSLNSFAAGRRRRQRRAEP